MANRDEIARLEAMHAANPEGRVFAHLAEAYRKSGELVRAREVLEAGLQRHPGYASAHVVLGRVLLDLTESDAADAAFRRVLELDPHNLVALRARADIAHDAGNRDEALRLYRDVVALDPSDDNAVLRIAENEARGSAPAGAPDAEPTVDTAAESTPASSDAEPDWGEREIAETPAEPAAETPSMAAQPATEYGEASLPTPAEAEIETPVEPAPAFEAMAFGTVSIDETTPAAAGGEVDLGLGGMLEPTDLAGPGEPAIESGAHDSPSAARRDAPAAPELAALEAAAEASPTPTRRDLPELEALAGLAPPGPRDVVPDAVLDISGLGGSFTLPTLESAAGDELGLPGFDEIAADATPAPAPAQTELPGEPVAAAVEGEAGTPSEVVAPDATIQVPSAPAEEPAPAPAAPPASETAGIDALPTVQDEGAGAPAPDVGPELITETIGDLYAQQGLHERAADVYARLLDSRPGDAGLQSKLDAARAGASGAAPAADLPALVPADAEPEAPFDLPSFTAAEPEAAPLDLPPLEAAETAPPDAALPWEEPAASPAAEPPIVAMEDLGLEPIGGGDLLAAPEADGAPEPEPTPAPEAEPDLAAEPTRTVASERQDLEAVESAWTGGAGAAAGTDSPFGWAEPEAAPAQSTIGEYFDALVSWQPPAAEPSKGAEAAAPEAPAPEAPAPPPTTPLPAYDDIDALFAVEPPAAAAPSAGDDIDALFADTPASPAVEPAPPPVESTAAAPDAAPAAPDAAPAAPDVASAATPEATPAPAEAGGDFGWDPFADLAAPAASSPAAPAAQAPEPAAPAAPPVAGPDADVAGSGASPFEWDPFAELTPAEEQAPPPAAPEAAEEATEADAADDDEDIDMFRAWLQSLKR